MTELETLRIEYERMKAERDAALERCRELEASKGNGLKYQLGQEVYVITYGSTTGMLFCPTCNGKGKIKVMTSDYGELTADCPDCCNSDYRLEKKRNQKYRRSIHFYTYHVEKMTITDISIESGYTAEYGDGSIERSEDEIFETKEAAEAVCAERNKNEYEAALKRLPIEDR